MRQLMDRFDFRIGPTTVAFVKSTKDDRLWCAHTMRFPSFRRLCVQQNTKIAWCVPGFSCELNTVDREQKSLSCEQTSVSRELNIVNREQKSVSCELNIVDREQKTVEISRHYSCIHTIDASLASNYRLISITPAICRLFERILADSINYHMHAHNLITDAQYGFGKGRSTELQLLKCTNIWIQSMDQKLFTDTV